MQTNVIVTLIMLIFVVGTFLEVRSKKDSNVMVSSLQNELKANMEKLTAAVNSAGKEINEILKTIHTIQKAMEEENKSTGNLEKQLTSLLQLTDSFLRQVETLQAKAQENPRKHFCPIRKTKPKQELKKKDKENIKVESNETKLPA